MAAIANALIPIAGKGTRLRPVTYAIPKALLPIVRGRREIRTVLEWILLELAEAQIHRAGIICSPDQARPVQDYLDKVDCGIRLDWIIQPEPAGFGDAVLRGARALPPEPFALMLGDHLHLSEGPACCTRQVCEAFESVRADAVVGMQPVGLEELAKVGVAAGQALPGKDGLYRCVDFVEKPSAATARERLRTPGLAEGTFLAHCGIYAFSQAIVEALEKQEPEARKAGTELQLAAAQLRLLETRGQRYFLRRIEGVSLDIGTPEGFSRTQALLDAQADATPPPMEMPTGSAFRNPPRGKNGKD
jgi:UTP--glucose-1-phosphate uridylyltransferase